MQRKRIAIGLVAGIANEAANKLIPLATLHLAANRLGLKPFGLSQFSQWLTDLGIYFVAFGFATWAPLAWRQWDSRQAKLAVPADKHLNSNEAGHTSEMDRSTVFSSVTLIRLIHAMIAAMVLCFSVRSGSRWNEYQWILLPSLFIVATSALDCLWAIIYLRAIPLFSSISIAAKVLGLLAIMTFVRGPEDALVYTLLLLGMNAIISLTSFAFVFRKIGWTWPSRAQLSFAFMSAVPFAGSALLLVGLERIDLALVEYGLGSAGAGAYAGPMKIAMSLLPIAGMIATVFFSEMLSIYDTESMLRHLRAGLRVAILLLAPIVSGVWFVYLDIVPLILGKEFVPYSMILPVLCSSVIAQLFLLVFGTQVLTIKGRVTFYNLALLLGLASIFAFSGFFGHKYGLIGYAWTSVAGRWIAAFFAAYFAFKVMEGGRRGILTEILLSLTPAVCMVGALCLLPRQPWFLTIAIGGFTYVLVATILFRQSIQSLGQKISQMAKGSPKAPA